MVDEPAPLTFIDVSKGARERTTGILITVDTWDRLRDVLPRGDVTIDPTMVDEIIRIEVGGEVVLSIKGMRPPA